MRERKDDQRARDQRGRKHARERLTEAQCRQQRRQGNDFGAVCDACSTAIRAGAIRPFSVICAAMPSTITTTNERRLPRPSSTSAREPQPFDSTMP